MISNPRRCAAALLLGAAPAFGQVVYQEQHRELLAQCEWVRGETHEYDYDQDVYDGLGEWAQTVAVDRKGAPAYDVSVAHRSVIDPARLECEATIHVAADSVAGSGAEAIDTAWSFYAVNFEVTGAVAYTLDITMGGTGSVEVAGPEIYVAVGDRSSYTGEGILPPGSYAVKVWDYPSEYVGDGTKVDYTTQTKFLLAFGGKCHPDCNGDGRLNVNDFICMQSKWRARDAYGDYDGSGTYTVNDFIRFQGEFVKGCK